MLKHQKAQEIFYKHLETLRPDDKSISEYMSEVETSAITMEATAKDIAFNEGFNLAVKLILSSIS